MTAALEWDYSDLAAAYAKRPDYADAAIDRVLAVAGLGAGATGLDVGAGVGHLTIKLVERGLDVAAVEPNQAMRERGPVRAPRIGRTCAGARAPARTPASAMTRSISSRSGLRSMSPTAAAR